MRAFPIRIIARLASLGLALIIRRLNDQFRTSIPETEFGNFPKPLPGQPYGYLLKGKLHGCTREELIRKCSSRGFRNVQMVWTPENPYLVRVAEVPFLFDTAVSAYRFRLRAVSR